MGKSLCYVDSAKTLAVTVYPSVLARLSSEEVKILEVFQQKGGKLEIKMDGDPLSLISEPVTNLIRLGIVGEIAGFYQYPSHLVIGK